MLLGCCAWRSAHRIQDRNDSNASLGVQRDRLLMRRSVHIQRELQMYIRLTDAISSLAMKFQGANTGVAYCDSRWCMSNTSLYNKRGSATEWSWEDSTSLLLWVNLAMKSSKIKSRISRANIDRRTWSILYSASTIGWDAARTRMFVGIDLDQPLNYLESSLCNIGVVGLFGLESSTGRTRWQPSSES